VLCANNQDGIDIVLPICETGKALSPQTVTATVVQVKNDGDYQVEINNTVLDRMNPISVGMFPDGVEPKPVIRIVFALASKEADVKFPEAPDSERERHHDEFTAFDIWIAGLSAAALNGIDEDLEAYQKLLDRSLRPHDAFILKDEGLDETTRKAREDVRRRMVPLVDDEG